MDDVPLLSLVTFLPLVGALFILFVRGPEALVTRNARYVALWTSIATLLLSLLVLGAFDPAMDGFQLVEKRPWLPGFDASYHMGVDGVSVWFVLLCTLLTPICILSSWGAITKRVKEFMVAFLVLETLMIGMFCALDMLLFYVFFEAVLIPMFLIIGIWGGSNRIYAAFKFFLYTLVGSVLMLVGMVALYWDAGTTDLTILMSHDFPENLQMWVWWTFFIAFAVKVPMWPVHTWLPDAHVEAPTAGSVILAGVLLKMGGYGMLRFNLPMMPLASVEYADIVFALSCIAIVYTSLVALAQEDMKKLIAYSSVAHMGFVTLGIFSANQQGIEGAVFQMLSHGIVSAALFLCVGVVYDRLHTREIHRYSGLVTIMPKYAVVMMILMLGAVGLPGTSGFVGEFLSLLGAYQTNTLAGVVATTGIILGAVYMLLLYRRMIFGTLKDDPDVKAMPDLTSRESLTLLPLVALCLWMGVLPDTFLNLVGASVETLVAGVEDALRPLQQTAEAAATLTPTAQ